jgi:hypothetical protein
MEMIKKHKATVIGALLGLVAGYLYWFFIGCNTGTCAITSSPVNSSLYGIFLGGIIGSNFKKKEKEVSGS